MQNTKRIYRIKDLRTGEYIRAGYARRSSWSSFPSSVIKNNPHVFQGNEHHFQIDMFETNPTKSYTIDKKEIVQKEPDFEKLVSDVQTLIKVKNKIILLVKESFDVDVKEDQLELDLRELGLDSLDMVELVMHTEREFNTAVADEDLETSGLSVNGLTKVFAAAIEVIRTKNKC